MLFTKISIALAILDLAVAAATTCIIASAKAWPAGNNFGTTFNGGSVGSGGKGGSGGDIYGNSQSIADCSAFCKQDQACRTGCYALILQGQCNAIGGSACEKTSTGTGNDDPSDGLIKMRNRETLDKRATLSCSTAETCYQYTDKSLLCINMSNGSYHDDVGGNGSLKDGTYTSPSGVVQTGTGTPANVATVASTTSRSGTAIRNSPAAATGTGSGTTATRNSIASTGTNIAANTAGSQTAPAAAATKSSAAKLLRVGGVAVGALGLAVGLVL